MRTHLIGQVLYFIHGIGHLLLAVYNDLYLADPETPVRDVDDNVDVVLFVALSIRVQAGKAGQLAATGKICQGQRRVVLENLENM